MRTVILRVVGYQKKIWILAVLFALVAVMPLSAQVLINLRQPPPNQFREADLWQLTLVNTGRAPIEVFLIGTITEQRSGLILRATTRTFSLPVGTTVITNQNFERTISPVGVETPNPRYRDIFQQTGSAPTGSYEICVRVFAQGSPRELASDCIEQTIEQLSQPILIAPAQSDTISLPLPVFTWVPPAPAFRSVATQLTYKLRIVEVLGRQSPTAAMQTNPAWFEQDNLRAPTLVYQPAARGLQRGKRYAWTVYAFLGSAPAGQSEVWDFIYDQTAYYLLTPVVVTPVAPKPKINVMNELLKSCN
jgi:hypothetical protein